MTLRLTHSLTEMSSWGGKGDQGWQPYHLHVPTVLKSGSLNLLEPSGPVQACNGIGFTFYLKTMHHKSDMQQVPHWVTTNISHHLTKLSRLCHMVPGFINSWHICRTFRCKHTT
jgi:hypothetical protein